MAATSQVGRGGRLAANTWKRCFITHQQTWNNTTSTLNWNRAVHTSVYDKNLDDQLCPTVVPDDVMKPQSDKYWVPHPHTGVFAPAATITEQSPTGEDKAVDGESNTVLEQQVWFRSVEDVDKPRHN